MMGRNTASGWSFTGGFGAGLVLGVVGTAVAYFGQRPDPIPLQEIHRIAPKGQDFLAGYTNAFEKSSKEKDQRAALGGGLLGTIVVVTIVLSAGS